MIFDLRKCNPPNCDLYLPIVLPAHEQLFVCQNRPSVGLEQHQKVHVLFLSIIWRVSSSNISPRLISVEICGAPVDLFFINAYLAFNKNVKLNYLHT